MCNALMKVHRKHRQQITNSVFVYQTHLFILIGKGMSHNFLRESCLQKWEGLASNSQIEIFRDFYKYAERLKSRI